MICVGTAGWSIPRAAASGFPEQGSGLERYASRFPAVEINSTFYRPHRPQTFERWARSVPDGFRFAVKVPKAITHERRLVDATALLDGFLAGIMALEDRLGPLLIQLPPSLAFNAAVATAFLGDLRARTAGFVACEPRHPSWFSDAAGALLVDFGVARVAADPARVPEAAIPGGWSGLVYRRLHGSPQIYRSAYGPTVVAGLAEQLRAATAQEIWCIFDNTASGAATGDALLLEALLRGADGGGQERGASASGAAAEVSRCRRPGS